MANDILNIVQKVFFLSPNEVIPDSKDSRKILTHVLSTLTGKELIALLLRNVSSMTYKQAGIIMGVTGERVRQIEAKGYRMLRRPSRSGKLKQLLPHNCHL